MRRPIHKLLLALVMIMVALLFILPTAWADAPTRQADDPLHLEVWPGESKETTVELSSDNALVDEGQLAQITVTVSALDSVCRGTIGGTGVVGQLLWTWDVTQSYISDGQHVYTTGHWDRPTVYYRGWNFRHSSYSVDANGTHYAEATSRGFFSYQEGWQRKIGQLQFGMRADGRCGVWGIIRDW